MPLFVAPGQLKPFITKELLDGPLKPIDYLDENAIVRGYDASVLAAVCNIWLRARESGATVAVVVIIPGDPVETFVPFQTRALQAAYGLLERVLAARQSVVPQQPPPQ